MVFKSENNETMLILKLVNSTKLDTKTNSLRMPFDTRRRAFVLICKILIMKGLLIGVLSHDIAFFLKLSK